MDAFEMQNEDYFGLVRANRECHPKGERVVLASESKCKELIQNTRAAQREAAAQKKYALALEAQKRAWHVITAVSSAAMFAIGVLVGVVL